MAKRLGGQGEVYLGGHLLARVRYALTVDGSGALVAAWGQVVTDKPVAIPLEQDELFVLHLEDGRKAAFLWTGFDGMRTYQIRVSGPIE